MRSKIPGSHVSRRGFMRTGLGVGAALLLPDPTGHGLVSAAADDHEAVDASEPSLNFTPGAPFVEPEVRRSANGELNTTLRMRYAYKDLGGYRLYMRTYEGTSPGPTLRLKPGDVLRIKLINDLPPNRDPGPVDHAPAAPFQHHQPSFPRSACQSERHLRQCHARDGTGRELRHRDRHSLRPYPRHQLVSPARAWLGRRADRQRRGGRADHRRRFRRCPGDRRRAGALAGADRGGVRPVRHGGGFRNAVPGTRRALLRRERRPRADHHHAARRGAALAHPARGLAGRLVPGLGRAHAEFDRPRRHPTVAHGPERSTSSPISPPTIRMPC